MACDYVGQTFVIAVALLLKKNIYINNLFLFSAYMYTFSLICSCSPTIIAVAAVGFKNLHESLQSVEN